MNSDKTYPDAIKTIGKNYFKIDQISEVENPNLVYSDLYFGEELEEIDLRLGSGLNTDSEASSKIIELLNQIPDLKDSEKLTLSAKILELKPKSVSEVVVIASSQEVRVSNTLALELAKLFQD